MMCIWQAGLTIPTTSYANSGGQGNRTGSITVTTTYSYGAGAPANLVDGDKTQNGSHSLATVSGPSAGNYFRFDFGAGVKKYIDEASLFTDSNLSNGTWKWQGSNDASSWTDLATFTWQGISQTVALTGMDLAGYRYYQIVSSGSGSFTSWLEEFEFKIAPGAT